jgi:hypothetical protein
MEDAVEDSNTDDDDAFIDINDEQGDLKEIDLMVTIDKDGDK